MTTLHDLLTQLVASGRWENWHALHDCLVENGREADAAWIRGLKIYSPDDGYVLEWIIVDYVDDKKYFPGNTESAAHAELLNRLCARLGYRKEKCKRCFGQTVDFLKGTTVMRLSSYSQYDVCPCTECSGRGFHIVPASPEPCKRCGGRGDIKATPDPRGLRRVPCPDCQGQGTIPAG